MINPEILKHPTSSNMAARAVRGSRADQAAVDEHIRRQCVRIRSIKLAAGEEGRRPKGEPLHADRIEISRRMLDGGRR